MKIMKWKWKEVPRFQLRRFELMYGVLALVFVVAGAAKLHRLDEFEATLIASRLAPVAWARMEAIAVIVLEFALAAGLSIPRLRTTALQMATPLICVFVGFSIWRWWQNIPIPCHCFGVLFTMTPWQAVLVNFILLGITTLLLVRPHVEARHRGMAASAVTSPLPRGTRKASDPSIPEGYVTWEELFP